jgi:hypothetical protein
MNETLKTRTHRFRFRPRFTLRTMLVVITVVCILIPTWILPSERQRRATDQIESVGGNVLFTNEAKKNLLDQSIKSPRFLKDFYNEPKTGRAWYEHYFNNVVFVAIDNFQIERFAWSNFPNMEILMMWQGKNHDPYIGKTLHALSANKKLHQLIILDLPGSLDDDDLKILDEFSALEGLDYTSPYSRFTDAAIAHVIKAKNLERLTIEGEFSDEAILRLTALTKLKHLYLGRTTLREETLGGLRSHGIQVIFDK